MSFHSNSSTQNKLLSGVDTFSPTEIEHDGIPLHIQDNMKKEDSFVYFSLLYLNCSVLWAYYSCMSAQSFYLVAFYDSGFNFAFLTTLSMAWPMFIGMLLILVFGLDKKLSQYLRVNLGFLIYLLMAIFIMAASSINFTSNRVGAILILISFGCIGLANSLSEANFYALAALYPTPKYTNAVQIGNALAGVLNISLNTILRLLIGGFRESNTAVSTSFYVFFAILFVVCIISVILYHRLTSLPSVNFLIERNEAATSAMHKCVHSFADRFQNMWRVYKIIWLPALVQFLTLFVSLLVYPGFGCSATRNLFAFPQEYKYVEETDVTARWYCSPGVIGSYNFGDFIGRILCTATVYKIISLRAQLSVALLRFGFIPLLLMGVSNTSFYVFGANVDASLMYVVFLNFLIGFSNGLLANLPMGSAPRMLCSADRESGGNIMVVFLFLGISCGAHLGYLTKYHGWFGI